MKPSSPGSTSRSLKLAPAPSVRDRGAGGYQIQEARAPRAARPGLLSGLRSLGQRVVKLVDAMTPRCVKEYKESASRNAVSRELGKLIRTLSLHRTEGSLKSAFESALAMEAKVNRDLPIPMGLLSQLVDENLSNLNADQLDKLKQGVELALSLKSLIPATPLLSAIEDKVETRVRELNDSQEAAIRIDPIRHGEHVAQVLASLLQSLSEDESGTFTDTNVINLLNRADKEFTRANEVREVFAMRVEEKLKDLDIVGLCRRYPELARSPENARPAEDSIVERFRASVRKALVGELQAALERSEGNLRTTEPDKGTECVQRPESASREDGTSELLEMLSLPIDRLMKERKNIEQIFTALDSIEKLNAWTHLERAIGEMPRPQRDQLRLNLDFAMRSVADGWTRISASDDDRTRLVTRFREALGTQGPASAAG